MFCVRFLSVFVCIIFTTGAACKRMSLEEDLTVLIDYEKYQELVYPNRIRRQATTPNQSEPLNLQQDQEFLRPNLKQNPVQQKREYAQFESDQCDGCELKVCDDPVNEVYQKCGNKCVLGCRYAVTSSGFSLTISKHDCEKNECVEGCFCKTGLVRHQTKCIPATECPVRKCSHRYEVYMCGPASPITCDNALRGNEIAQLTKHVQCVWGCFCAQGYLRSNYNGKCVPENECRNTKTVEISPQIPGQFKHVIGCKPQGCPSSNQCGPKGCGQAENIYITIENSCGPKGCGTGNQGNNCGPNGCGSNQHDETDCGPNGCNDQDSPYHDNPDHNNGGWNEHNPTTNHIPPVSVYHYHQWNGTSGSGFNTENDEFDEVEDENEGPVYDNYEDIPAKVSTNQKVETVPKESVTMSTESTISTNYENKGSISPSEQYTNKRPQTDVMSNIGQNIEVPVKLFGAIKGDKAPVKPAKPPFVVIANTPSNIRPQIQSPTALFGVNGNHLFPNAMHLQNQPNKQFNFPDTQNGNLPINAQNPFVFSQLSNIAANPNFATNPNFAFIPNLGQNVPNLPVSAFGAPLFVPQNYYSQPQFPTRIQPTNSDENSDSAEDESEDDDETEEPQLPASPSKTETKPNLGVDNKGSSNYQPLFFNYFNPNQFNPNQLNIQNMQTAGQFNSNPFIVHNPNAINGQASNGNNGNGFPPQFGAASLNTQFSQFNPFSPFGLNNVALNQGNHNQGNHNQDNLNQDNPSLSAKPNPSQSQTNIKPTTKKPTKKQATLNPFYMYNKRVRPTASSKEDTVKPNTAANSVHKNEENMYGKFIRMYFK